MGRPKEVEGGRPKVLTVRLSEREAALIDAKRGALSRSAWARWALLELAKRTAP